MKEKNYENKIKKYLKESGAWYVKYWGGGIYTKKGIPDILVCLNGQFLAIEVKGDGGTLDELQKEHIKMINDAGGVALCSYPDEWNELKQIIDDMKKGICKR